jgi:anion-transporting  ArsA/GET3 family ATPase
MSPVVAFTLPIVFPLPLPLSRFYFPLQRVRSNRLTPRATTQTPTCAAYDENLKEQKKAQKQTEKDRKMEEKAQKRIEKEEKKKLKKLRKGCKKEWWNWWCL